MSGRARRPGDRMRYAGADASTAVAADQSAMRTRAPCVLGPHSRSAEADLVAGTEETTSAVAMAAVVTGAMKGEGVKAVGRWRQRRNLQRRSKLLQSRNWPWSVLQQRLNRHVVQQQ